MPSVEVLGSGVTVAATVVTAPVVTAVLSATPIVATPVLVGHPGADGAPGEPGEQGDPGPAGGAVLASFWQYSNATSEPPGSGQMRTDVALTTMWVSEIDTDGYDRSTGLATIVDGATLYVRSSTGSYADWRIAGTPVDNGGYWTFPIGVTSGSVNKGTKVQLNFIVPPPYGMPPGGTVEQVLTKHSDEDFDVSWQSITPIVVSATQPTASDYGLPTIPVGAVWIQQSP